MHYAPDLDLTDIIDAADDTLFRYSVYQPRSRFSYIASW